MQDINHTRIRTTIGKMTDLHISKKLLPLIEKNLVKEINNLLNVARVIEIMKASKRITLFRKDLDLKNRYLELGEARTFAESELRKLILKNIGQDKHIQSGVIKMVRGYLVDGLNEKIKKVQKLVIHSPNNKTIMADHWEMYFK